MLDAIINNNVTTARLPRFSNSVKTAAKSEENRAIAVVMMGFSTDPVARWIYPDAIQYLTHFPGFIKAFAGKAFENESAFYIGDFAGAALWLPPDVHPDEDALIQLFENTVSDEIRNDLFQVFEQMDNLHPSEPHWYLPMIGVDTFAQNKGYGSALMRHALAVCDRGNKPAYLESSNPRNIALYRRYGFELIGTIQSDLSPPVFPMLRQPRQNNL